MRSGHSPVLSVVIPVRDRRGPLAKCLQTLAQQISSPPFEVIVVDDGSRHRVECELERAQYPFAVTMVRQVHLGIAAARNRGLSQAQAPAALFIDSDCEADSNLLRELAGALDRSPGEIAFQASLYGRRENAVGRIEDLRLRAVIRARTLPDGGISYLNTSGFVLRRSETMPWPEVFDVSALRDTDTLLLARLTEKRLLPRFVPTAIVYHVPATSLPRYLWKQGTIGYRGAAARQRLGRRPEIYFGNEGRRQIWSSMVAATPRSLSGGLDLANVALAYALERAGGFAYSLWGMKPGRTEVLAGVLDSVTESEVVARLLAAAQRRQGLLVTYLNGWTVVLACQDQVFAEELKQFDLCYADGVGAIYALVLSRLQRVRKVTANEFFFDLCAEAARRGVSLALIGAGPGIADHLANRLKRSFPHLSIPVVRNGFLSNEDEERVVAELRSHQVELVVIGRGQPLQERWACRLKIALPHTVIFCVGGLFDYATDKVVPTSRWIRRLGFEWLHRFLYQPRTYWRYYVHGIPLLFLYVLKYHLARIGHALRRPFGG